MRWRKEISFLHLKAGYKRSFAGRAVSMVFRGDVQNETPDVAAPLATNEGFFAFRNRSSLLN